MMQTFQRDDEHDAAEVALLADTIKNKAQIYSDEENFQFTTLDMTLGRLGEEDFVDLVSPDHFVKMFGSIDEDNGTIIGRAVTTCDAATTECAAWSLALMNREKVKIHTNEGGFERSMIHPNEHTSIFHVVLNLGISNMKRREFVSRFIWKWDNPRRLCVCCDGIDHPDFRNNPKYAVRGSTRVVLVFEELPPVGDIAQTRVTFTQDTDVKGSIPKWVAGLKVVEALGYLSRMRNVFDKSSATDSEQRLEIAQTIEEVAEHQVYSDEEAAAIEQGLSWFLIFENNVKKRVHSESPAVTNEVAFNKGSNNDHIGWGRSEAVVRGSKEEVRAPRANSFCYCSLDCLLRFLTPTRSQVLAYFWSIDARCRWGETDMQREILESKSAHRQINYFCKKEMLGHGVKIHPRESVNDVVWKLVSRDTLFYVSKPGTHHLKPIESRNSLRRRAGSAVRASWKKERGSSSSFGNRRTTITQAAPSPKVRALVSEAVRIKVIAPGICRVTYVTHLDLKGRLPLTVTNIVLQHSLFALSLAQEKFQMERVLDDYDEEDGRALGLQLFHRNILSHKGKKKRLGVGGSVDEILQSNTGLKELTEMYPWLTVLLQEAVKGRLAMNRPIEAKLSVLTVQGARSIGANLGQALRQRKTAEAGLYQWKMQNPAMVTLFEMYPFAETMMLSISQEVLKTAPWGLIWRVLAGASLSTLDLVSDLNVIFLYLRTDGQSQFAYILLAMIVANLVAQLVVSMSQYSRTKSVVVILREIAIVLLGMKPAANVRQPLSLFCVVI